MCWKSFQQSDNIYKALADQEQDKIGNGSLKQHA